MYKSKMQKTRKDTYQARLSESNNAKHKGAKQAYKHGDRQSKNEQANTKSNHSTKTRSLGDYPFGGTRKKSVLGSRKSPNAKLFDVDTKRIFIRHCELLKEHHSEQTKFSIPSTSDNGSRFTDVPSESPEQRWLSDSQNELREFYKTDVIPMSRSLYKTLSEIKEEIIEEVQEMLNIFETMEQKFNGKSPTEILLQKEIDRLLEVSLTSEI
ncbi:hypothetical protein Tco_0860403 [Tanacetum coccineum]|uniref:Uncharacterized protein n=1 Tax=Tanacetum coccineum TaxID=301880 RepID=A0ABQ5BFF0_9ASTR